MINLMSQINRTNLVNFSSKGNESRKLNAQTTLVEERMNKLFGVSLDEFISVCDNRKAVNESRITEEYCDELAGRV